MSKNRVAVAMSGGVDSSVAAAFLKEKGYDVIGLTMNLQNEVGHSCFSQDVEDAQCVARILDIPHHVVSFEEAFQKHVIDYFVTSYLNGRTPNPCAVCNQTIKFGELLKKAQTLGATYLATGHYAKVTYDAKQERYQLQRGKERGKDQSYFLARLSQDVLKHILFPVGSFTKMKIRKLAERFGLPVAEKKESQEVCFIPGGDVVDFIRKQTDRPFQSGPIVDGKNQPLGTHPGIVGYTIGQRKGLGIALGEPVYVTKIAASTNTVFVGKEQDLYQKAFEGSDTHWISNQKINGSMRFKTRIRYQHRPDWADVFPIKNGKVNVQFLKPQRAITPGQLAVFYDQDVVVGSAWIDKVKRE
ncbi:tRNA 2-thiouridine(34) synthase MnmA [bacterium]|nr:tRNA 2-thiouridine(34) synthase MnmA [bacterium]